MARFAYADPPYIGQARKMYGCNEIDHKELLANLGTYYGWALSCSSSSLREILPLCPADIRIAAWVKPFAFFKGRVRPPYAWEPVIFKTPRTVEHRPKGTRDWISLNAYGVSKRERETHGVKGAKRPEFSCWVFALLGMTPEDEFDDLFPGSGMVTEAWQAWRNTTACRQPETPSSRGV